MIKFRKFDELFDVKAVNALAYSSGLIKRTRKITGFDLVISILYSAVEQMTSYNTISCKLFIQTGKDVSRQRLHKIISSEIFHSFFKSFLDQIWKDQVAPQDNPERGKFNQVILQDSTILKLPKRLFARYSGVSNASSCTANCRVQICIDLMTNLLQTLSIDSYSINDVQSRHLIKPKKGDLVIRDRGYFALDQLYEFLKEGIHFIIRHKSNSVYYDQSGRRIDLIKVLSKRKNTVLKVRVGKPDAPILTMFAQRVNESIAAQRQRAVKLSIKGRKPSALNLEQQHWSIYLTSLSDDSYTFQKIWDLYSLRWRIEIMFKALKTHLHLDSIQNVSSSQLKIIISARIAVVVLITIIVYNPLQEKVNQSNHRKNLSLIKLVGNMVMDINLMFEIMTIIKNQNEYLNNNRIIKLIKCSLYDSRQRKNYETMKKQNL